MAVEDTLNPTLSDETSIAESLMAELVRLRKKRKIGQSPIAEAIGITQGRVSQIENMRGGVTLDVVLTYARVIGANIVVVSEGETD